MKDIAALMFKPGCMRIIKNRTTLNNFAFSVLVAALLVGCSGPPSENTGRKVVERQIQTQSNGKIKLVSFKKSNGMGDDHFYQLEYEAEIEFLADGAWARGTPMDSSASFEFSTQAVGNTPTAQMMGAAFGAANVHRGQRETIKSALRFEKTENGWRGQDGQIY